MIHFRTILLYIRTLEFTIQYIFMYNLVTVCIIVQVSEKDMIFWNSSATCLLCTVPELVHTSS